ncbi:Cthe-2314-like HEPN domain-containing protein [uncultured Thiomicrorhabdus sp.]
MFENNVEIALDKVEAVKKFFTAYSSSIVLFNTNAFRAISPNLPPNIQTLMDSGQMGVRVLERAPIGGEHVPAIEANLDEIKRYMLDEGQHKIFEYSITLLYSSFEGFIRNCFCEIDPDKENAIIYVSTQSFAELNLQTDSSVVQDLLKIREIRNCYMHNKGIWDSKSAGNLSKVVTNLKDESYLLQLPSSTGEVYTTAVGDLIQKPINSAAVLLWMCTVFEGFYNSVKNT